MLNRYNLLFRLYEHPRNRHYKSQKRHGELENVLELNVGMVEREERLLRRRAGGFLVVAGKQ